MVLGYPNFFFKPPDGFVNKQITKNFMVYQCFSSISLAITSPFLGQIADISESDPLPVM